jgi:predicted nucleic acid-binding protein
VIENLVLDNTVLSHFARADELDNLERLCEGYRVLVPTEVQTELVRGASAHPSLSAIFSLAWIKVIELTEITEVIAFAKFYEALGATATRHRGEAAVLAYVEANGGVGLIDERAARTLGDDSGLEVRGTLWLIVEGVKSGRLDRKEAEDLVTALAATDMWLPMDPSGFFAWAYSTGLLP